ncbi:MAG TPA: MFS transporter [Solirubrobacterales bacterium]|nr:MFS transporter [Solirubrobacterales bacterium]
MALSIPALRPLRHRDFRLLWIGLAVSLAGDGLWLVALAFQVIELDGGPVQLSFAATAYSAGLILLMLPSGLLADRLPRRLVMLTADVVRAATVAAVAALSLSGSLELWHLVVASGLIGAGEALFIPSYSALIPRLLPEEEILAANGLESILRPLAQQAVGPAVGGIAIAAFEPGLAILFASGAFLVSAGCLIAMRVQSASERSKDETPNALSDLREGVRYVRATPWLWATLSFAVVAVFFFVGPIEVLAPFVITERVGGGSAEFGLLLAMFGIGSAVGALAISSRPLPKRYLTVMLVAWGGGSLPLILMGISTELWVLCTAVFFVGATDAIGMVIWGTLLQTRVPDPLRGRVSSLDFFVSLSLLPISMALAGPAGEAFGLTAVFLVAGIAPVVAAIVVYRVGRVHEDELANPVG